MTLSRHHPGFVLLVAAVFLSGCGSSQPEPSSTRVPGPASSAASPALSPATPAAASPAAAVPSVVPSHPLLDQVVVTVSDRLRVRSEPRVSDDSIMYEPVLPLGTELTVLDGPVSASGYTWYKVAPVSFIGLDGPGFGWVAVAGTDGEPWIAGPTANATPIPSSAASGPATGAFTWQRVTTPTAIVGGGSRGLTLRDLAAVPGGFLADGGDVRGAVVLSSPDGVQWTRARDEASFDYASLKAVAARGGLIVAVGTISGSARGLLWTTTDGLTWRDGGYAFAGNIEVVGVAAGASSFVVAGSFRTLPDASGLRRVVGAAWASADGRTWNRFVLPADAEIGDFRLTSVSFVGSRFVSLGRASGGDARGAMLVWTSSDGREWQRGQDIPVSQDGSISGVALGPTGALVAVGWTTATPAHAAAFTSPDGLRWAPVPDGQALEGAVMRGLACDERQCLAVGETAGASPSNAASWTTTDGVAWSRTGSMSGLGDVGMRDVALRGQGAVAIGWAVSQFEGTPYVDQAAFWISPPVTLPDPVPPPAVATIAGHWETLPPMMTPRINPVVSVGKDGRLYVFGGGTRAVGAGMPTVQTSSVEIYDPATNAWSPGTPIPGPGRIHSAAVTAADGRIFLFHGSSSLVLVYDPVRSAWATGPSVPAGRHVAGAMAGPGQLLSVFTADFSPFWLYSLDPMTERWRSINAIEAIPVASGVDGLFYGIAPNRAWAIDPATGRMSPKSPTPLRPALAGKAALGPGGFLWVVGVENVDPAGGSREQWRRPVAGAYNPATDSWMVAPPTAVARWGAVTGSGDRLYVVGGTTWNDTRKTVEVFVADSTVPSPAP